MLQVDTKDIPISVTTGPLSRKNSSNSYSSAGTLSRRDSSNSYASTGSLSRKNSSNSLQSKQGKRKSTIGQQSPTSTIPFPWKLHRILDDADIKGFSDIISWVPSENGFKVHKTKQFDEDIMPKYFDKTKYKSFQRQLNMWGFDRVGSGPYKGAYLHSCFVRGQPQLCEQMQRTKIKGIHSKKLRKKGDMLGGSNHSLGSSNHSLGSLGSSNHSLGDSLGRGSNHSVTSVASATPSISDIEIHASIKRAADKVADLEQQKEEIQRKLQLLSTQTSAMNMPSQPLQLPEDDLFSPLPLNEGDSLLFGGRNFFFSEDGKYTEKPSNQQRRRAGRRYSLELKGPDSHQYVLKELQGNYSQQGMGGGSNNNLNENFMSPTPLGPDGLNVVTATTNIPNNRNSSLNIGLDIPARRFSFLSTPVHNPFEKTNHRPPRHPTTSNVMNSNMSASNNNNFKMMNMDAMTNNMMNMNMNMNSMNNMNNMNMNNMNTNNMNMNNMNMKPFDQSINNLSGNNSFNNLLRMNSWPSLND